jgi:hypothetical protein
MITTVLAFLTGITGGYAVLTGFTVGIAIWLVTGVVMKPFLAIDRANPSSFRELRHRAAALDAEYPASSRGADLSRHLTALSRELKLDVAQSDGEMARVLEELQGRRQP